MEQGKLRLKESYSSLVMFFIAAYMVFVIFFTSLTILPMYVIELGGNEFDSGLQTTLFFIFAVILRFYFGPLADSKGRKLPLLIGTFVFATSGLFFMLSTEVWHLTLARLYQSLALATFLSSGSSLVADMAPLKLRGTYIGMYRLIITLGVLTGPVSALEVIKNHGYNYWFVLTFIGGIIALALIMLVKAPPLAVSANTRFMNSIYIVFKNRVLWPIYAGLALTSICYGAILTFASLYISQVSEAVNPGIYFTYFGISGVLANISAGYLSDRYGREAVVWPAAVILGVGLIVLAFVPIVPATIIISGLLTGIGWSGGIAAFIAWLIDLIEDKMRGTVLSIQESIIDTFVALGSLVFGTLAAIIGMQFSFVVTGSSIVVITAILLLMTKRCGSKAQNEVGR